MFLSACGGGGGASPDNANAALQPVEITPTNPTVAKGTTLQYNATGISSDHSTQDITTTINWSSSDPGIATINSSGVAKATAVGTTTIIATDGTTTASTTLTVTAATLQSISVTPTNPTIAKGTTQQFTATGIYSDNTTQDITSIVTWRSSATNVATISMASGFATSASAGTTTITATDPATNISGSDTLTVTAARLVSISISPTNPGTALGTSQQFIATGTYSDNSTQDITASVTWSSSSASTATISNAVGSNGSATPMAAGSATITATLGGLSNSTTFTVTPATLVSVAIAPSSPEHSAGDHKAIHCRGDVLRRFDAKPYYHSDLEFINSNCRSHQQCRKFKRTHHRGGCRLDNDRSDRGRRFRKYDSDCNAGNAHLPGNNAVQSEHSAGDHKAIHCRGDVLRRFYAKPYYGSDLGFISSNCRSHQQCRGFKRLRHPDSHWPDNDHGDIREHTRINPIDNNSGDIAFNRRNS